MTLTPSGHRQFGSLTAAQIATELRDSSIAVLPVGAIEQHGPHLPLAADLIVAEALATAVVESRGRELDLWQLPPLAFSKSNEHSWSPGTIWITSNTMLHLLCDIARSLAQTPIRKIAILNGHGGNSSLLDVALRDLRVEHGLMLFLLHTLLPPEQGGETTAEELDLGIHGGRDETALLLHVTPGLVDMTQARREVPEWLAGYRHVRLDGPVRFGWSSNDISPTGVIGDPTLATRERGKELFEQMVATVGDQLAEVAAFRFEGNR